MYPCIRITACESQHTHLYIRIRTYVSPHYYIRTYVSLHYYIRIITYVGISKHAPLHTYHNILISTHVPLHANQYIRNTHTYRYISLHIFQFHSSRCLIFFEKPCNFRVRIFYKSCAIFMKCAGVCVHVCACVCICSCVPICVYMIVCIHDFFSRSFSLSCCCIWSHVCLDELLSCNTHLFLSPYRSLSLPFSICPPHKHRQTDKQTDR